MPHQVAELEVLLGRHRLWRAQEGDRLGGRRLAAAAASSASAAGRGGHRLRFHDTNRRFNQQKCRGISVTVSVLIMKYHLAEAVTDSAHSWNCFACCDLARRTSRKRPCGGTSCDCYFMIRTEDSINRNEKCRGISVTASVLIMKSHLRGDEL
jgi:hypothetical protein